MCVDTVAEEHAAPSSPELANACFHASTHNELNNSQLLFTVRIGASTSKNTVLSILPLVAKLLFLLQADIRSTVLYFLLLCKCAGLFHFDSGQVGGSWVKLLQAVGIGAFCPSPALVSLEVLAHAQGTVAIPEARWMVVLVEAALLKLLHLMGFHRIMELLLLCLLCFTRCCHGCHHSFLLLWVHSIEGCLLSFGCLLCSCNFLGSRLHSHSLCICRCLLRWVHVHFHARHARHARHHAREAASLHGLGSR
mmetsp:Transcript_24295/g.43970  ORF Transcript_24295/g.43970 Transcript_24295/m.43970 type:complete len:251 (-) Transcript_24295:1143-1895(-)